MTVSIIIPLSAKGNNFDFLYLQRGQQMRYITHGASLFVGEYLGVYRSNY